MTEACGAGGGGKPGVASHRAMTGVRLLRALAFALLPFGCLGGQTGQPSSTGGGCDEPTVEIPVDRPHRGVVPIDAGQALEGTHTLAITWIDDQGVPLPEVPTDEITLTFTYDGGTARYAPCDHGGPNVEMTLVVTTRDSGLVDDGTAWVSFFPPRSGPEPYGSTGESGSFVFSGTYLSVSGRLIPDDGGTVRSGRITTTALAPPLGLGILAPP
jgi:hypothetical protein